MKKKGRGSEGEEAKKNFINSKKSQTLSVAIAAVIVSSIMIAFVPLASAGVTSFMITPETDIADATSAYKATVNTTGFTSLNITIPAGFEAVTPTTGGKEIARVDLWWTPRLYGYVTFTANASDPSTKMDVYADISGTTASLTEGVNYTEGAVTSIESPFGTHPERANLTLPTTSEEGCLSISGLPDTITNVTVNIGEFVKNPSAPGNYTFTAKADGEPAGETETVVIKPAPPAPTPTPIPHRGGRGTPRDSDDDGLSDIDEMLKYKTDPYNLDTDGGGVDDATEIARGTNPLDPTGDVMPTPSPTPSPTPKPWIPRFEAVFTIAGLLAAVAYLVLRRKK